MQIFLIPSSFSPAEHLAAVGDAHVLLASDAETFTAHYFDTFDWQLQGEGLALYRRGNRFQLRQGSGDDIAEAVLATRKGRLFWRDFPEGPLRDHLHRAASLRALLPQFSLERKLQRFSLLNRDEKTVVRLVLCEDICQLAETELELPAILQVEPLKGYDDHFLEVCRVLADSGLTSRPGGYELVAMAQELLAIDPGATSSKFVVELDGDASVAEAVRDICLHLLATIHRNLSGTIDDIDTEFLHDLRVAVRRTRSLLTLMKKRLPRQQLRHFQTEFKWLGTITGPVRDLDVYLLKEEDYRTILPRELQPGVDSFFATLVRSRKRELRKMRQHLRSARFVELVKRWPKFLDELVRNQEKSKSRRPCRGEVSRIISKRIARILQHGQAITPESPAEQLHDLRIEGKKFRYLLEFFRTLYDPELIDQYLKKMKRLQSVLGDFNDLSVQKHMLLGQLKQSHKAGEMSISTAASQGGLVVHLKEQQHQVRDQFAQTFEEFASVESADLMARILLSRDNHNNGEDE